MLVSTAGRNAMATGLAAVAGFVSLHSAWTGDTGANEISGGTPPYARKPITWGAAAAGSSTSSTQPALDVPAGTTVAFAGLWTLVTAGTFLGCSPLGGGIPKPFTADSATEIATIDAHGLTAGQQVIVISTSGTALPTGLVEGTIYFVKSPTTNGMQLSATNGGAAIDLTSVGAGFLTTIVPETFGSQGTLTLSSDTISANQ